MKKAAKVAVSIPAETLAALERLRRKRGQSRSSAVAEAIEAWLKASDLGEADRRYAEAYLRDPEAVEESAAIAEKVVTGWEPWE